MSEVRSRSQEDPMPEEQRLRGVTPRPRSGAGTVEKSYPSPRSGGAAGRSYPTSEVRGSSREELPTSDVRGGGREELPRVRTQGRLPAWKTNPTSKELRLCSTRVPRGVIYPTLKVRKDGSEEIPFVQGKEQRLCFAGAAMKRYPMPKVRQTQVRR